MRNSTCIIIEPLSFQSFFEWTSLSMIGLDYSKGAQVFSSRVAPIYCGSGQCLGEELLLKIFHEYSSIIFQRSFQTFMHSKPRRSWKKNINHDLAIWEPLLCFYSSRLLHALLGDNVIQKRLPLLKFGHSHKCFNYCFPKPYLVYYNKCSTKIIISISVGISMTVKRL